MHRQAAAARRDRVDGHPRDQRAREGAGRDAHRLHEPAAEPEHLRDDHAEGGTARDPEHRRLGQRIAREGLEPRPRHRERTAREQGGQDARQPQAQHHDLVHAPDATGEDRQHVAGRHPRAAEEEGADRGDHHHEAESDQQHREPRTRGGGRPGHRATARTNASG